jgi:hypothetical protein
MLQSCRQLNQQCIELFVGNPSAPKQQNSTAFLYLASDVIWFCNNFEKTFKFGEVPQTVAAIQKDLLDYYVEEAVETGQPHEYVVLVEGAIIVQFGGSPPQAYHMDVLYPHYQVGGCVD